MAMFPRHELSFNKEFGRAQRCPVTEVEDTNVLDSGKHGEFSRLERATMLLHDVVLAEHWMLIVGMLLPSQHGR